MSAVFASTHMVLIIAASAAAAMLAARYAIRRLQDGFALAVLALLIGLPLWATCDSHLLNVLPTVWWFEPREPFAPYFLLYLPLSITLAVMPAAALIGVIRLCAMFFRQEKARQELMIARRRRPCP